MDFSFPAHVERFRDELRNWLAAHLTADIVTAGRLREVGSRLAQTPHLLRSAP